MRVLTSDVTKLLVYFVAVFVLAATVTPWVYNAGVFLGEITEDPTGNAAVDYVGEHARKADFPDFFKRALLGSALLLLVPLLFALRLRNNPAPLRTSPWSIYLPPRAVVRAEGQPLRNPRSGVLQLLAGLLLAAGLLFAMGWLLLSLGWFTLDDPVNWSKAWRKAAGPAVTASLLEELIFRGVLLGICLRAFRPAAAITVVSLLFAALHFLQPPDDIAVFVKGEPVPEGAMFIDPNSTTSGFQLLLAIAMRFQQFDLLLFEFASLLAVGLILGYARYATASLWLPIGLHSGWIFAYTFFDRIAARTPDLNDGLQHVIGSDLKEGFMPLATLAVTGFLVVLLTRIFRKPGPAFEDDGRSLASGVA